MGTGGRYATEVQSWGAQLLADCSEILGIPVFDKGSAQSFKLKPNCDKKYSEYWYK